MKKSKLLLIVSLVLALTMSLGGTLAYLTDTDEAVNVMTLGNVQIEQIELQRKEGVLYNATAKDGDLEPFEKGQTLYPAYPVNGEATDYSAGPQDDMFEWGPYVTADNDQNQAANGLWNDANLKGAMDKFVFVENTGDSPAYFRTWLAFEKPDSITIGEPANGAEIMINMNHGYIDWDKSLGCVEIEGTQYEIFCLTYNRENGVLPAGEIARPSLLQVVMTHHATNEDMEALGKTYEILAFTQAVQTNNFEDANQALTAAFGEATLANHPWTGDVEGLPVVPHPGNDDFLSAEDEDEILKALAAGQTVAAEKNTELLIDLSDNAQTEYDFNGGTVIVKGDGSESGKYGYVGFIPEKETDVTIKNLNVTGTGFVEVGHYGIGGGDYNITNLKIENLKSTLANGDKGITLGCAFMSFGNADLNDCVIKGTTAVQEGVMPVDLGCGQGLTTNINDGEYGVVYCWSHSIVNVNGAEIDTLQVAPIRGKVTVNVDTHVGTIVIDYGTSATYATKANLQKLTIDDDATVDQIVYGENTYTVDTWNAYVNAL